MTASRGIGRGRKSSGPLPGAGRPKGAINKRTLATLARVAEGGGETPLDFVLKSMRDDSLPLRDRLVCAGMVMPYLHSKLHTVAILPNPDRMDDLALATSLTRLERHVGTRSDAERAQDLATRLDGLLEELPGLSSGRQGKFLSRLIEAAEAGLQRLDDPARPGAVAPRSVEPQEPRKAPAPPREAAPGPLRRPGAPGPADGQRMRYDPTTKTLEPV